MINLLPGFASAKIRSMMNLKIFSHPGNPFVVLAKGNPDFLLRLLLPAMLMLLSANAWTQDIDCMKSGCHDKMHEKEWVHGPVGANTCNVCHVSVAGQDHEFTYPQEGANLCFVCHEDKHKQMNLEHLHTPVAEGNCIGCHSPHQSDYQYQLLAEGADLCFSCHDSDGFEKEFIHGPVAVGECTTCHDVHGSKNEYQLIVPKKRICFECHPEIEDEANDLHQHDPVKDYCVNCHNPHSGPANLMLDHDPPQLCFECHKDIESKMSAITPHPPVAEGRCLECHLVHGSPYPRLFVRPLQDMCLECHYEMAEYLANSSNNHGPVREGDCIACHDPHGSDQPLILRQYFPREFYNPYSTDKYALCFNCHNKEIALDSLTTTLTDFRNGNINLHFKHVNKKVRGRSCKACHDVHASNQKKHIRKSVPYGLTYSYPINYTKHEDGGTCVAGCHKPRTYKRGKD